MKWFVLGCCALVTVAFIALTAIDKRDEQSCKNRREGGLYTISTYPKCQGFLPW